MDAKLIDILNKGAVSAASALLGWQLYKKDRDGILVGGAIIETEAYTSDDAASHSFNGKTPRNATMFDQAGKVYVYFTYGMHWCMNIVTGETGQGEAVLIRSILPEKGYEIISLRRNFRKHTELTNGPAKVCQALAVTDADNGALLNEGDFIIMPPIKRITKIAETPRIGIKQNIDVLLRFVATFE